MSIYSRRSVVVKLNKKEEPIRYKFNTNDPVLCTSKDCNIKNAKVLSRSNVNGENFYKIGNEADSKMCKEKELLMR